MRRIAGFFPLLLLAACAVTPREAPAPVPQSGPVEVQILALNDFHGNLEPIKRPIVLEDGQGGREEVHAGGAAWFASAVRSLRLPSLREEAIKIADLLSAAHQEGHAWGDMAILCRHYSVMFDCAGVLRARGLPHQVRERSGDFAPLADSIKIMTMHVSKGLEFPVVAIPGLGQMPDPDEDVAGEARLFYVAATRATHKLLVTVSGDGEFGKALSA